MATWDLIKELPLEVDAYSLEGRAEEVSSGFLRKCTLIHITGAGLEGVGEDVVYDGEDHDAFQAAGPAGDLPRGHMTLGQFCGQIAELDLFPTKSPEREVSRLYRRWAFDSAALDLALRQNDLSLAQVLNREVQELSFVVSIRLGEPASLEPITQRLAIAPTLNFKLDPTDSWTDELLVALAATGAVESVDFKALYSGTVVDQKGDVDLYARVIAALPEALIEDPDINDPAINELLIPHRDRITWDAPIESVADIENLAFKPRMVNIKPSRLGGLKPLLDSYDYCELNGIGCYGGGQFELGAGRLQNQLLGAIFHPDSPNDLAPVGWNANTPVSPLTAGPLTITPSATGFAVDSIA
ncbi:MAG: hypothetical protein WCL20_00920 [Actinomycetes bacterium]